MGAADIRGPRHAAQTRAHTQGGTRTIRTRVGSRAHIRATAQPGGGVVSKQKDNSLQLGDFTATPRVISLSLLAVCIGLVSTAVAWALLRLIAFFTNVFYYGRVSTTLVSPA